MSWYMTMKDRHVCESDVWVPFKRQKDSGPEGHARICIFFSIMDCTINTPTLARSASGLHNLSMLDHHPDLTPSLPP